MNNNSNNNNNNKTSNNIKTTSSIKTGKSSISDNAEDYIYSPKVENPNPKATSKNGPHK